MGEQPAFRKPDRYKASSYRSYNFKMPSRYDSCLWAKFCQIALWDAVIVRELRPKIDALRILDVGCATGRLLEQLAQAGGRQLCGADLAPRILEVAREKLARFGIPVDLRVADAEDCLPWVAESFDVVTLTGVLHHFYRPKDALAETRRVLRPGGRLLIIDPSFFTPLRQILNAAMRVAPHDGDCRFYSVTRATDLLAELGFGALGTRRVGLWAYLAMGQKPGPARVDSRVLQSQALPTKRLESAGRSGEEFLEGVASLPTEERMMFRYGGPSARSSSADR